MTAADGRYATLAQLTGWLGREAAVGDTDRDSILISDLLKSVEYEIDRVCATVFMPKHITALEVEHRHAFSSSLTIPYAQSVASVQYDGDTLMGWMQGGVVSVSAEDSGFSKLLRGRSQCWETGIYTIDGMFGYAAPPAEIIQAIKELVEFRYNTRQGIAQITGGGEIIMDGGKPYPASVYGTLRAYKQTASVVSVG